MAMENQYRTDITNYFEKDILCSRVLTVLFFLRDHPNKTSLVLQIDKLNFSEIVVMHGRLDSASLGLLLSKQAVAGGNTYSKIV